MFRSVTSEFDKWVRLDPHRPAVIRAEDGLTLSYTGVNDLARRFASALAQSGVSEGNIVAVLTGSSIEMPAIYLAILQLKAIFVPLDPFWPARVVTERLQFLDPKIIVCSPGYAINTAFENQVITLDSSTSAETRVGPCGSATAGDLVYGIFTSGTTGGKAKCALNHHQGLSNRFKFMSGMFQPAETQIVLLTSPITYDTSVWQLLWPLTVGARVIIPSAAEMANLDLIVHHVRRWQVTFVDFVPTTLRALLALLHSDPGRITDFSSLQHVIVGGESVHPGDVQQFRRLFPATRFISAYGPTETSIGVVFHSIRDSDDERVPLGRAIDGCFAVIVDEDLVEQVAGQIGQIVIGGLCVGAGYLHDRQLTDLSFVPNPLRRFAGDRIYLTGDLGFMDEDGLLFFAGRIDHEIKVNGVRIDPNEIERAACSCPGVESAVIVPFTGNLAAGLALVVSGTQETSESGVRRHLSSCLPRTLVPALCLVVDRLPLTSHGKVDRRQLRSFVETRREAALGALPVSGVSPRERVLSTIAPFLDGRRPAKDENFLDAGGDSLRAVAIAYALSQNFQVPLNVADLLANSSLDALEEFIGHRSHHTTANPAASATSRLVDRAHTTLLDNDAQLTVPIARWAGAGLPSYSEVLLTGATGYVGTRIASTLLEDDEVTLTCLVRAPDNEVATARLRFILMRLGLWRSAFAGRVIGLAADLTNPRLGLDSGAWMDLQDRIDVIVHAGARVNFLDDYSAHRHHNVFGTSEVLRLAMGRRVKPLYHLSTLAIFNETFTSSPIPEDIDITQIPCPQGGYAQSKWVTERLLASARDAGAPVTVLRLGEVMASADNAAPNASSLSHLILSTIYGLQLAPTTTLASDYTPVSYAAHSIVQFMREKKWLGRTVNLFHPDSIDFAAIPGMSGRAVTRVPDHQFAAAVHRSAVAGTSTNTAVLAALLADKAEIAGVPVEDVLASLLTDNPRRFGREACLVLEQRGVLSAEPIAPHVAAYSQSLTPAGPLGVQLSTDQIPNG